MTPSELSARFEFAQHLVRQAGQLAVDMWAAPGTLAIESKGVRDFATAADKAVERLILSAIGKQFGDLVLGEEFGAADVSLVRQGKTLWIVDPIDGTYNYMHGNPRWCVSLGLLVDGVPTLGVIYAPHDDVTYLAQRGCGAFRNGRPIRVSDARRAEAPMVEVGTSARKDLGDYLETVRRLMTANIETRRGGSGALGLAAVAAGEIDGYFERHIYAWDVAAALAILAEAGGVASDFFAGDGLLHGNPILAASPVMVTRLQEVIGFQI